MNATSLIRTHSLGFSFGRRRVLHDLDLLVPEGSIYGFLGPNGAGKTTTIKCLLGLYQVQPGMVSIFGKELNRYRLEILARTGNMVEDPSLYGHLSGRTNLEICRRLHAAPASRVEEVLEVVGLRRDAHRSVKQYSSGMKQRLSLAMALLSKPALLVLDEPVNGLDPEGIIEIRNLLQDLNRQAGVTIFISSHILSEIERLCSHVAVIHQGRLLFQGTMQDLQQRQSGKAVYLIETGEPDSALPVLAGQIAVMQVNGGLQVQAASRDEVAAAVALLVEAGIPVYQVKREMNDLEDAFLELIHS